MGDDADLATLAMERFQSINGEILRLGIKPEPSLIKRVLTKDDQPLRPESASASANDTRKRSPQERLLSSPELVTHVAIKNMERQIGSRALHQSIQSIARGIEMFVGQLYHVVEGDALDKEAKAVAVGRTDGAVDRLPGGVFRLSRIDLRRQLLSILPRIIVAARPPRRCWF